MELEHAASTRRVGGSNPLGDAYRHKQQFTKLQTVNLILFVVSSICTCSIMERTSGYGPLDGGSIPSGCTIYKMKEEKGFRTSFVMICKPATPKQTTE